MRFIGDIHAEWPFYYNAIAGVSDSIQVGDFGVGFPDGPGRLTMPNFDHMNRGNHRFIRGNHDNPQVCTELEGYWIRDGALEEEKIFCVGGAFSIDRDFRQRDINWWEDEECSYSELCDIIDYYEKIRPEIVCTHDAPDIIIDLFLQRHNRRKFMVNSVTRRALNEMYHIHQPKLWIHGHWHVSHQETINKTRFISLNINETYDVNLEDF
jgi:hypothetical protein